MMPSHDLGRFAVIIADNVVSAFERERDGADFHCTGRETTVSVLVRYLLAVLPTTSSNALAAACNRGLDEVVSARGLSGPRVDADDLVPQDPDDEPASVLLKRTTFERIGAAPARRGRGRPSLATMI